MSCTKVKICAVEEGFTIPSRYRAQSSLWNKKPSVLMQRMLAGGKTLRRCADWFSWLKSSTVLQPWPRKAGLLHERLHKDNKRSPGRLLNDAESVHLCEKKVGR